MAANVDSFDDKCDSALCMVPNWSVKSWVKATVSSTFGTKRLGLIIFVIDECIEDRAGV